MRFVSTIVEKIRVWCLPLLLMAILINLSSCGGSSDDSTTITGEWYQEADVDFSRRFGAVTFTIGDSVYIGCGFNGSGSTKQAFKDLNVYVESEDTWRPRASMPDAARARNGAVAFTSKGKAYVGLGLAEDGITYLKDFWSFNNTTGEWKRIADFPGVARSGAMAFTIDDRGFVGNGKDDNQAYKDFYEYDEENDKWIDRPAIPLVGRDAPFSFVIDGIGYVGGGRNNGAVVTNLYAYDPEANKWTAKNDLLEDTKDDDPNDKGYGTIGRDQGVAFVIDNKAYVTCGYGNSTTWQYVPGEDRWYSMNAFEGVSRYGAVGFTKDNTGHVATGFSGSSYYFNDKWKYDPTVADE